MPTRRPDRNAAGKSRALNDSGLKNPTDRILATLRDRFTIADDAEREDRKQALIDDNFKNLEQWDPKIKQDRERRQEPCLVIDSINTPLQQVVNGHRNSRPGIKVSARGGGASKKAAEVRQSLVRQIEHDSYAPAIYAHAFDQAASGGWGYWRVNVEHVEDHPTDLEVKIDQILNRYSVRRDPTAQKPTKEDARWWIITDDMPLTEYVEEYPDSEVATWDSFSGLGDEYREWIDEETVRVVEYWFRKKKKRRTFQLADGRVKKTWTLDEKTKTGAQYREKPRSRTTIPVTSHRDIDDSVVMWCKCNAVEILEGNEDRTDALEWPGKYIPIVEMTGEQVVVGNRVHRRGMIRRMRDPQIMLNVEASDLVTTQARSPKHVWAGYLGQFGSGPNDPNYDQWAEANTGRRPMVQAVPTYGKNGELLPPPTLQSYEPPIQNMVAGINLAAQFIKDTSGWYGASLGDISPDRSGRAIDKLTRASEQGSSHYSFAFETALAYTGRICIDLFEYVYDRPGRQVHIMGPNNEEDSILVNQLFRSTPEGPIAVSDADANLETDEFISFADGKFGVSVSPGRNFATMREEKADALQTIGAAAPQLVPIIAPDMVEALDFPGSSDIAERIDAANPPELRRKKAGTVAPPREMVQQMGQMEQVIKALTAQVQALTQEQQAKSAELASNEKIAAQNNAVKMAIEELKIQSAATANAMAMQQAASQAQYDALQGWLEQQAQMAQQASQQAHEREQMVAQMAQQQDAQAASANGSGAA